jgi:Ser/Thr protein kinase RdoA (MazF antagonist)
MVSSTGSWGEAETRFFYALTPDRILDAVEACGLPCTGRCVALNSMENRVYEVEIDLDEAPANPSERFRIVKFYRPGRWTEEQILEEHRFLRDLVDDEIPVVAPIALAGGSTLAKLDDLEIRYAVWPRIGGRVPDELSDEQAQQLGRLIARVHSVGARADAHARIRLDPATYGREDLAYLLEAGALPPSARDAYRVLVENICALSEPWFENVAYQRIHGDCHLGNVLWGRDGAFLVDFDDMVRGPCVQDVWLLVPGNDDVAERRRTKLLEGYEQLRDFDFASLRLVEPLRALRVVHFSAWISRRWDDPAFKRVFTDFGTERYWFDEIAVLQEQLALIQDRAWG